jgi:hypothetical protein
MNVSGTGGSRASRRRKLLLLVERGGMTLDEALAECNTTRGELARWLVEMSYNDHMDRARLAQTRMMGNEGVLNGSTSLRGLTPSLRKTDLQVKRQAGAGSLQISRIGNDLMRQPRAPLYDSSAPAISPVAHGFHPDASPEEIADLLKHTSGSPIDPGT